VESAVERIQQGIIDYEILVLGGIIPTTDPPSADEAERCGDHIHYLMAQGVVEKMSEEAQTLVRCVILYREQTQNTGHLTEEILLDMMVTEQAPPEIQVKYQQLFHTAMTLLCKWT